MNYQEISSRYGSFYSPMYDPRSVTIEERKIMERLVRYGAKPTGILAHDKKLLKEFELKEAQTRNSISTNFLIVTQKDLEELRTEKSKNDIDPRQQEQQRSMAGATLLGEQMFLAITMNQKEKTKEHRKVANSSEVDN